MSSAFISIPINVDADQALADFNDQMATAFPGWTPAEGNIEVWIARWAAALRTDLAQLAADVPAEIFYQFGAQVLGLAPIAASAAIALTTWTVADDAGYTIPAGTLVGIPISGDQVAGFAVANDVIIPAGDTVTDTGAVILNATVPGEASNGLTSTPSLIDALIFVDGIALESATSGGVDAEDPTVYLDRLVAELQLLTPRPIIPRDVEALSRNVAGVARATALDGYNPGDDTYDNERMVAVAVIDENGAALSGSVKAAVDAALQAQREVNFIFNVIDPTSHSIDVSVVVVPFDGFDPAAVVDEVTTAISTYLSPANWGKGPADTPATQWRNVTVVRQSELVTIVNNTEGVDYIDGDLELCLHGGTLGTADVSLSGPAPLPASGDITVTT